MGASAGGALRDASRRCNDRADTLSQDDIDDGELHVAVGVAPSKPAEFVVVALEQLAGHSDKETGMSQFQPSPPDPYRNFSFRLRLDGRYVAGMRHVTGLPRNATSVGHADRDEPSTSRPSPRPGRFKPVTMKWGITHDRDLIAWAESLQDGGVAPDGALTVPRNVTIEELDDNARVVDAYGLRSPWISKYVGPALDSGAGEVAFDELTMQHDGLELETIPSTSVRSTLQDVR